MNILLINNIPTPYRTYLFDTMHELSHQYDINFHVFYQFRKEKERHWDIKDSDLNHKFFFSNKVIFGEPNNYNFNSFNVDLLFFDFKYYDFVIFSPLMSFNNLLLSQIIPKHKQLHWIESNLSSTKSIKGIRYFLKKIALKRSSMFLVPGVNSINYIEKFKSKNTYINFPNLIDFDAYRNLKDTLIQSRYNDIRNELNISLNTKVFLVLGEICERKGSDRILDIVKNVEGDYIILMIGTGDLEGVIKEQIQQEKFNSKVKLLGQLPPSIVKDYFAISDVFLHLARRDPSPLVCIEALTSGLVMAVSEQTGNSPEVVDGNGVVFDINNDSELFTSVSNLINLNDVELGKLREKSWRLADDKYRPEEVIGNLFKVLKNK